MPYRIGASVDFLESAHRWLGCPSLTLIRFSSNPALAKLHCGGASREGVLWWELSMLTTDTPGRVTEARNKRRQKLLIKVKE